MYLLLAAPLPIHTHQYFLVYHGGIHDVVWVGEKTYFLVVLGIKLECTGLRTRLRNFPVEGGTQIQVHGIWTKILPGQGSFLLTLGFSAMVQIVEFAERPASGEMGL